MAKTDDEKPSRKKTQRSEKLVMISALYDRLLDITSMAIKAGEANLPMGLMGMAILEDVGHGGAYAAPLNKRPYFMTDPQNSPYYAGPNIKNITQGAGLGGYFASLFAGQNAGDLFTQVMMDANVPHVLPKLISDEQYAQFWIIYSQLATTDLFQKAGTGLLSLVEGGERVSKSITDRMLGEVAAGKTEAETEAIEQKTEEARKKLDATVAAAVGTAAKVGLAAAAGA
jgi:hypothetical protein